MSDMTDRPPVARTISTPLIVRADAALRSAAAREQITEEDLVNRAVILYEDLAARRAAGSEILARAADGTLERLSW